MLCLDIMHISYISGKGFLPVLSRHTVVGREAKKKQPTRPYRVLFTRSTALKLVSAVAKPP